MLKGQTLVYPVILVALPQIDRQNDRKGQYDRHSCTETSKVGHPAPRNLVYSLPINLDVINLGQRVARRKI